MLENRWEMARWITSYISENEERWTREKFEREKSEKKWISEWAKMTRLEKIRRIKEKEFEKETNLTKIGVTIIPGKLCPTPPTHKEPHHAAHDEHDPHAPSQADDQPALDADPNVKLYHHTQNATNVQPDPCVPIVTDAKPACDDAQIVQLDPRVPNVPDDPHALQVHLVQPVPNGDDAAPQVQLAHSAPNGDADDEPARGDQQQQ